MDSIFTPWVIPPTAASLLVFLSPLCPSITWVAASETYFHLLGPHYNPLKQPHAPSDAQRHAGDLGNIVAGPDGVAHISIEDRQIPLTGLHSILGRAVVVHADPDDLGKGGHELSKTAGNAGARVGCGIIGLGSSI